LVRRVVLTSTARDSITNFYRGDGIEETGGALIGMSGGHGPDRLGGAQGDDRLFGREDDDRLFGGGGRNRNDGGLGQEDVCRESFIIGFLCHLNKEHRMGRRGYPPEFRRKVLDLIDVKQRSGC